MSDKTCLHPAEHSYVVEQMRGRQLRAYYTVECEHCGDVQHGYHDEIPTAKFK